MGAIRAVQPPEPGTYGRVLRRYDRKADLPIQFNGYDVTLRSKPIEAHGVVAATLFFPPKKTTAALRAGKEGWKDETEAFAAHVRGEPKPLGRKPRVTTPPPPPEVPGETKPKAPGMTKPTPDAAIGPAPGARVQTVGPDGEPPATTAPAIPGITPIKRKIPR